MDTNRRFHGGQREQPECSAAVRLVFCLLLGLSRPVTRVPGALESLCLRLSNACENEQVMPSLQTLASLFSSVVDARVLACVLHQRTRSSWRVSWWLGDSV